MRVAFKEWAIIVEALMQGEQILILRKGGIREGNGGFKIDHKRFLLFPTLFHQQRESVIPKAQDRFDQISPFFPSETEVDFLGHAELVGWKQIEDMNQIRDLQHLHIWKPEVIEERFNWGAEQSISLLAVRAHRLFEPIRLPMVPEYGGCKSWIDSVVDIDIEDTFPALTDDAFSEQIEELEMLVGDLETELPSTNASQP
ncbi:DUF1802 family protein [Verrucomicrobia bacterium]|nr:DUF1802 family protein [Verrucomicrobiota bacterium]